MIVYYGTYSSITVVVFVVAGSNTLPSFEPIWMSPLQHCSPGWSCPSHAKSTPTRCLPCDLRDPKFLTPCDTPKPAKLRPALSEMTDVCSHLYPGCRTKLNGLAAGMSHLLGPPWKRRLRPVCLLHSICGAPHQRSVFTHLKQLEKISHPHSLMH